MLRVRNCSLTHLCLGLGLGQELALGLRLRLGLAAAFYPIDGLQVWSTGPHFTCGLVKLHFFTQQQWVVSLNIVHFLYVLVVLK